jgi:sulfate adenylyltransferase subunit 2
MARGTVVLKSADESRNKHQSVTLLEAIEEFGFRRLHRRRPPRRGKGPRQGTHLLVPRRIRPVGPEEPAPGTVDLYNARSHKGENIRAFPISNWTEIDVWQYIEREQAGTAVDLLRPHPPGRRARAASCRSTCRW